MTAVQIFGFSVLIHSAQLWNVFIVHVHAIIVIVPSLPLLRLFIFRFVVVSIIFEHSLLVLVVFLLPFELVADAVSLLWFWVFSSYYNSCCCYCWLLWVIKVSLLLLSSLCARCSVLRSTNHSLFTIRRIILRSTANSLLSSFFTPLTTQQSLFTHSPHSP